MSASATRDLPPRRRSGQRRGLRPRGFAFRPSRHADRRGPRGGESDQEGASSGRPATATIGSILRLRWGPPPKPASKASSAPAPSISRASPSTKDRASRLDQSGHDRTGVCRAFRHVYGARSPKEASCRDGAVRPSCVPRRDRLHAGQPRPQPRPRGVRDDPQVHRALACLVEVAHEVRTVRGDPTILARLALVRR